MKFTCNVKDMDTVCQNLIRILPAKTSIPSLEGILLEVREDAVTMTAYNLETGLRTSLSATSVEEEGSLVLPGKIFANLVHGLSDETMTVWVKGNNTTCHITSGSAKFQIQGMNASEFPELPVLDEGISLSLLDSNLRDLIHQTEYAVNPGANNGILLEYSEDSISMTATDGYRIAVGTVKTTNDGLSEGKAILPVQAVKETEKLIEQWNKTDGGTMSLTLSDRHVMIPIGTYTLLSRLLDGEFPNPKAILSMPTNATATVDRKALIQSVERVSLVAQDRFQTPLRCEFSEDTQSLNLSMSSALGEASDEISLSLSGEATFTMGMNYKYLLDALKAIPEDTVELDMSGSVRPLLLKSAEESEDNKVQAIHLVCPVRLRNNAN